MPTKEFNFNNANYFIDWEGTIDSPDSVSIIDDNLDLISFFSKEEIMNMVQNNEIDLDKLDTIIEYAEKQNLLGGSQEEALNKMASKSSEVIFDLEDTILLYNTNIQYNFDFIDNSIILKPDHSLSITGPISIKVNNESEVYDGDCGVIIGANILCNSDRLPIINSIHYLDPSAQYITSFEKYDVPITLDFPVVVCAEDGDYFGRITLNLSDDLKDFYRFFIRDKNLDIKSESNPSDYSKFKNVYDLI
jgi:hypothetical protein